MAFPPDEVSSYLAFSFVINFWNSCRQNLCLSSYKLVYMVSFVLIIISERAFMIIQEPTQCSSQLHIGCLSSGVDPMSQSTLRCYRLRWWCSSWPPWYVTCTAMGHSNMSRLAHRCQLHTHNKSIHHIQKRTRRSSRLLWRTFRIYADLWEYHLRRADLGRWQCCGTYDYLALDSMSSNWI